MKRASQKLPRMFWQDGKDEKSDKEAITRMLSEKTYREHLESEEQEETQTTRIISSRACLCLCRVIFNANHVFVGLSTELENYYIYTVQE